MTRDDVIRLAKAAGMNANCGRMVDGSHKTAVSALKADVPVDWLEHFATLVAAAELERICAAIDTADNLCRIEDYMLDSEECIKVARGQWRNKQKDAE